MRVLFQCDKCGYVFKEQPFDLRKTPGVIFPNTDVCPVCHPPEPTYGPLTVENVAEALCFVAKRIGPWENVVKHYPELAVSYCDQARMVLKMLNQFARYNGMDWYDKAPQDCYKDPVKWMIGL